MKKKILILGSTGFIGNSLFNYLKNNSNHTIISTSKRTNYNLLSAKNMNKIIKSNKPDIIINCLGVVGGIQWGIANKLKITLENNTLTMNLLNAIKSKKTHLINIIANCIYPFKYNNYSENLIFDGAVHPSVFAYGMSRRLLLSSSITLSQNSEVSNTNIILANVYGPGDHFDEYRSHALGGLIKKFYNAKINKEAFVEIWGTGKPKRDWIYIDDVSKAILSIIKVSNSKLPQNINIASSNCISIKYLANKIRKLIKYKGKINFNTNYQDGDPIKKFSTHIAKSKLKWKPKISIEEGLQKTINYYIRLKNEK